MPIFRVKSVKIYTGQKNLHEYVRGVHDKYQVCPCTADRIVRIGRVAKFCIVPKILHHTNGAPYCIADRIVQIGRVAKFCIIPTILHYTNGAPCCTADRIVQIGWVAKFCRARPRFLQLERSAMIVTWQVQKGAKSDNLLLTTFHSKISLL